jgi:hypothetical protein
MRSGIAPLAAAFAGVVTALDREASRRPHPASTKPARINATNRYSIDSGLPIPPEGSVKGLFRGFSGLVFKVYV